MPKAEARSDKTWSFIDSWVGRTTAIAGLVATLAGGITWWVTRDREHAERKAQLVLAQSQAAQGNYSASLDTYGDLLKTDPLDRSAQDGQLNTAMLWTENFSVLVPEGGDASAVAGPQLDRILTTLESGLAHANGPRTADIQAHLGWAHWLNQHIAAREFGSAAETNFRAALASDPQNVYAHAMLGNWLLQTGGDFADAVQHFRTAVATGNARPFVRRLQIGGLVSHDDEASRAELFTVANQMRTGSEPLDSDSRRRIADFCCNPGLTSHSELVASLSAVSTNEAWQTYVWLDDVQPEGSDATLQALTRSFIQANLLEIGGKHQESLASFRRLQAQLAQQPGSLKDAVDASVVRLQHPS
jgi:Tfp pilus assembly protein PilF